jgi:asparagine synthase (glutamine-hydrolysing)
MCGIAGIISKNKINTDILKKMTDAIAHRGPDGEGYWLNATETIGFAHRRLSIIDLTEAGKQPMHYNERYTITYNGEIYNYIELKETLLKAGYSFTTNTDTEVILAAYDYKKENCVNDFDGMFAFAIYDKLENKIFGARDRFGEKPFYYHYTPNQEFRFCSEIKGLNAAGLKSELNTTILYHFLSTSHILSNYSQPHETFYTSIHRLPKAHSFTIDKDLNVKIKNYWHLDDVNINTTITLDEAAEQFKTLFFKSVNRRLRSDVAVGSSLSGGLDSSSIVLATNTFLNQKHQYTFSARFKNFDRDEGYFINLVTSQSAAIKPFFVWPTDDNLVNDFEHLLHTQDEPIASASIYAQYCVMREAKQQQVTVLLDGQGADEILAGYEHYLDSYLYDTFLNNPQLYEEEFKYISSLHNHLGFKKLDTSSASINTATKINPLLRVFKPKIYKQIKNNLPLPGYFTKEFVYSVKSNAIEKYRGTDITSILKKAIEYDNLEDLLRYSDRNASAFSREVRLPFLSHELIEFLFSLPVHFKIYKGWTKYLLRYALNDILPNEIAWRVNKVGYETPQGNWLKNKSIREMQNAAFTQLKQMNVIDKKSDLLQSNGWAVLACYNLVCKK